MTFVARMYIIQSTAAVAATAREKRPVRCTDPWCGFGASLCVPPAESAARAAYAILLYTAAVVAVVVYNSMDRDVFCKPINARARVSLQIYTIVHARGILVALQDPRFVPMQ